jgi:septal ring factor EnvC (AmiA/AmiB activator)
MVFIRSAQQFLQTEWVARLRVTESRVSPNLTTYMWQYLIFAVKIDPSKERLKEALTQLRSREQTIGELRADLIESQEQLESANKDIDFYQHEKKRLMSASSFHGETYESTGQQVRAMQTERAELLKQLDAARGQTGLANEAVDRIQALLNNERKVNASLRQKQELTTLQADIKHAQDSIVAEEQRSLSLQHEIRLLQNTILALKNEVAAVKADEQAAVAAAVIERQKQDALKDDVKALENKLRAEVLSSVQATAERNAHQPNSPPSRNDLNSIARKDYPRFPTGRTQSDRDSGPAMGGAAGFPRSQTTSPTPQAKSPGTETGFRTIHGQHRPDGSLGGYRSDRAVQRTPSDNLYESSVQNGQSGERALSSQTSRSDGQSVTSSDEAQPGQGWGTPPKRKNETERTRWG